MEALATMKALENIFGKPHDRRAHLQACIIAEFFQTIFSG
jgi:hypothetical protein